MLWRLDPQPALQILLPRQSLRNHPRLGGTYGHICRKDGWSSVSGLSGSGSLAGGAFRYHCG